MKEKIHVAIGSKNPCKIDAVKAAFHKVFDKHLQMKRENKEYELVFSCHNAPSKVNDQPIGDDETLLGAKNRALGALEAARTLCNCNTDEEDYGSPDFGVGLEGGIDIRLLNEGGKNEEKELWCMAWMAIVGTNSSICTCCKHDSSTFEISSTSVISSNEKSEQNENPSSDLKWGISKTASFKLPQKISNLILNEGLELGHADDAVFNRVNSKQGSGTVGVLTNDLISRSEYYDHALVLALISFIWPEHY